MFLNPWYGQVGGGPEGARVHTAEEGTAATAAAAVATAAAASGVGGDDDDDRVPATSTSSSITAATGYQQQQQQQTTAVNSIKATASSVDSTEATATMSDASAAAAATPVINRFEMIQQSLKSGWTAHVTQDGRLFYCNHINQTSSWLPPIDNWNGSSIQLQSSTVDGASAAATAAATAAGPPLPYGWEAATDRDGRAYFINHLNKTTTYEDPRRGDWGGEEPPQPRNVELCRHPELGFGFVAGSEKPVIVRFVTEGGPSVDKLLPGDQIWRINGEDVKNAPRDHVIQLVRSCKDTVHLSVCQPPLDNSTRKSALLSAAKKAKLRNNPSRVRFAEGVVINGTTLPLSQSLAAHVRSDVAGGSVAESAGAPLMPNVMKVYLENGQTKSFKYDSATTVADVLNSLQQKLGFKSMDHFSLCVEHVKSIRKNKLTLLDPAESLAWIAARPGAHNLRCMLRVAFVPKDAYDLLRKDMGAFEYLYMQCCNDVVQERFAPELKYDIALRIAALHMHQHAITNKMQAKLTVKNIEREYGLERFVPTSLVEAMKRKELRKLLSHFVKVNQQLTAPGQKQLTALQAKLHYLKIIAELPSYGAKCFSTNFKSDANVETVILVSPKYGISQISGMRSSAPLTLCNIEDITSLNVRREDELTQYVEIRLKDPDKETLVLSLEERDSEEIILVLRGYHKLATDRVLPVHRERSRWSQDSAPPYHTRHTVQPSTWNFVDRPEVGSKTASAPTAEGGEAARQIHYADLSVPPPYHPPPPGFQLPSTRYPSSVSDQEEEVSVEREFDEPEESAMERLYDSPRSLRLGDVSLALTPQPVNKLDSNMNKPLPNNNSTAQQQQQQQQQQQGNQFLSRLPTLSSVVRQSPTAPRRVSTLETAVPSHKLGFDMPSVVSMEILESQHPQRQQQMQQKQQPGDCSEARNDAVIQRVSELKRLVEDAEQYLTGGSGNGLMGNRVSDVETSSLLSDMSQLSKTESDQSGSGTGAGYGRLRHSDSLLLLTTGQKQLSLPDNSTILLDAHDHASSSDADTDSVASTPHATPTHSPMQRPKLNEASSTVASGSGSSRPPSMLKPSDSSFGLHSPDVLMPMTNGVGGEGEEKDLEGLLRRLQDDLPLAEGSLLYLDPDIIDLTMIPPPITPEEEGLKMKFPATINEPPTPFADRDSLENELIAIKQQQQLNRSRMNGRPSASELGELQDLTDLAQWTDVVSNSSKTQLDGNDSEDTLSLSGVSGTALSSGRSIESLASSSSSVTSPSVLTLTESKRRWIADEKRKHLATNPELDAFLSTVAVPLPPVKPHLSGSSQLPSNQNGSLFNNDDLSAYIIPPPPANVATTSNNGLAILQKLYAAREGIFQVMSDETVPSSPAPSTKEFDEEKDRGMAEMRVKFEQRVPNQGVSSKMSDLQRFLSSTSNNQSSSTPHQSATVETTTANTKGATPDLSPASSHSSGYGSLKSIADSNSTAPELPARQPAGQFSPRKNGFVHFKSPVAQHRFINGTSSNSFRPTFIGDDDEDDDDIPPPPPPPRNPIPRMILATATAAGIRSPTNSSNSQATTTAAPPPGPLTKSSSQGDLLGRATSTSVPNVAKMTDANRVRTEEGRTKGISASTESISTVDKGNSGTSSPSKLSMASSSDSIGSNASVATVKNAPINSTFNSVAASPPKASQVVRNGGGDATPPLPPRNSPTRVVMRPPIPVQQHVDTVKVIVNNRSRSGTGPISPASPLTPDSPSSPKPPALPSRLRKPGVTSPVHSKPAAPGRPIINGHSVGGTSTQLRSPVKAMAPPPPPLIASSITPVPVSTVSLNAKIDVESNHYAVPSLTKPAHIMNGGSPTKHCNTSVPNEYQTPNTSRLPRPLTNGSPIHSRGQPGAPLFTSSPKMGARTNASSIGNNVISLNIRVDGSSKNDKTASNSPTWTSPQHNGVRGKTTAVVHGGPEDNGSLDSGSFEQDSLDGSADFDLGALVGQSEMTVNRVISRLAIPVPTGQPPKLANGHEEIEAARERLINESRQFVTASKMFVKSVTDSPQSMAVCMQQCVTLVERMGQAAEEVAQREHSRDLPPKVRDVARAFLHTLRAAAEASGQGVSDPSMGRLMGKATALAGVLTILMRSLRT